MSGPFFRATLTYTSPLRTEGILVPLPPGTDRPPVTLRRPTEVAGLLEVFELIDDEDWDAEKLAGYVFVGTVDAEKSPQPDP